MTTKSLFSKIGGILKSTEIFERPSKKIRGTWLLFEYFMDQEEVLVHLQAEDLKAKNESFQIEFSEENFGQSTTLPIDFIQNMPKGKWEMNRNILHLVNAKDFRNNIDFQFAFDKDILKLLKKNKQGEIEFFGFFKKLTS